MKFEDVFLTEKQTILGPDRDVGSIPVYVLCVRSSNAELSQW